MFHYNWLPISNPSKKKKKKTKHNLAKGKPDAPDTHCENSEKISSFGSFFPYIHNVKITQSGKTATIAQLLTQTTSHYWTHLTITYHKIKGDILE